LCSDLSFYSRSVSHRDLPSFPTRRSFDLVNSGRSAAKGSDRKPRLSTVPAFLGRPPVQAGMVPAALPAFSAPSGVRVVPSLAARSEEHTSELQSRENLVCRLLLEKKKARK